MVSQWEISNLVLVSLKRALLAAAAAATAVAAKSINIYGFFLILGTLKHARIQAKV